MRFSATLSDDRRHAYRVDMEWDSARPPGCIVVGRFGRAPLSAGRPDLMRCRRWGMRLGLGSVAVVPLVTLIAPSLGDALASPDAVGPDAARHLLGAAREAASRGGPVIAAWGDRYGELALGAMRLLEGEGIGVVALELTCHGNPGTPSRRSRFRSLSPVPVTVHSPRRRYFDDVEGI